MWLFFSTVRRKQCLVAVKTIKVFSIIHIKTKQRIEMHELKVNNHRKNCKYKGRDNEFTK